MNKKLVVSGIFAVIAGIFLCTGLYAGTEVADSFVMETPGYETRTKGAPEFKPVTFNHKKHAEESGFTCGECHHDENGKPNADLKMGDDVHKCSECHNKFEKDPQNKKDIMVHENAIHGNCITCHKEVNKKAGDAKGMKGPAPATCAKCHVKAS
jgi:hypothetical protein